MKTTRTMMALALCAATMTTGCLFGQTEGPGSPGWEVEENEPAPALEVIFLSGHLGNYSDCPEDGYTERGSDALPGEPSGDREFGGGACAPPEPGEDSDGCGGFLNCQGAQFTIMIKNTGEAKAVGVDMKTIGLIGDDGEVATTLPVGDLWSSTNRAMFDGEVEVGEEVTITVDFLGPEDISEFVPSQNRWGGGAALELTVDAENHDDVTIKTKEVYVMSDIAT